jgi:pyridoxine kinase
MAKEELKEICEILCAMGPKKVVISGVERGEELENFVYEEGKEPVSILVRKVGPCRSGTGDVFSAMIAADAVNGVEFVPSVQHASEFISKVLKRAVELDLPRTDGLCIEECLLEI